FRGRRYLHRPESGWTSFRRWQHCRGCRSPAPTGTLPCAQHTCSHCGNAITFSIAETLVRGAPCLADFARHGNALVFDGHPERSHRIRLRITSRSRRTPRSSFLQPVFQGILRAWNCTGKLSGIAASNQIAPATELCSSDIPHPTQSHNTRMSVPTRRVRRIPAHTVETRYFLDSRDFSAGLLLRN